ncbi:CBS domain-containing protein [Sporohalobacter salinus]|uniref:CBS domain-containing protein n=1 Tax=Sporohalobacter salinus TaxID=1494606 RepID=UPI00196137FE|nr:CBS domain-containing protein [Sporohalobacter salinus]MBM7623245.1 CBS domain-containing protein [Sporohalobacter salinus]
MQIKDIMTSDVSTLDTNATVQDAAKVMNDLNVGIVPVCSSQKPVGVVTDRDIVLRNTAQGGDTNEPVEQVMSEDPIYGSPDMSAEEAAQLMAHKQIRRLPIVENDNIVGIVSLGDLSTKSQADMEAGKALSTISTPSRPNK